jgi:tight adherence protein B
MRRSAAFLTALTLGLAASPSAAVAQEEPQLRIDAVDVAGYPDVRVDVTVPAELEAAEVADQLLLTEDGAAVDTTIAQASSADLYVVLLVDTTGSMGGGPLLAAKDAASSFLADLPDDASVAVVGYDAETTVITTFDATREEHRAGIEGLEADGRTAMYDAVSDALTLFDEPGPNDRHAIVLLTDGEDNESAAPLDDVVAELAASGVVLHGVEYRTAFTDETGVRAFAEASRGAVYAAEDPDALIGVYERLASDLVSTYSVEYRSTGTGTVELALELPFGGGVLAAERSVELPAPVVAEPSPVTPEPPRPSVPADPAPVEAPMSRAFLLVGAGAWFLALFVLFASLFAPGRRRAQLAGAADRLRGTRSPAGDVADRVTVLAGRSLERHGYERGLNRALERAGISLRPEEFVVVLVCGSIAALVLGALLSGPLGGLTLAALLLLGARLVVSGRGDRRQARFAGQLGDTLQLLSGSLRAGYSLMQAVDAVARDADAPTSEEFGRLVVETRLGRDPADAMRSLADRMGSVDFSWVVQAIEIHREVGGDLAEVLDNVGNTIRERDQLRRQVKTVSAEGRLSGIVLIALPFFIGLWMLVTNPSYIGELTQGIIGWSMLALCAILMTAGALWIKVLVRLKF